MNFRLRCTCNRILSIPEEQAGRKGRCPGCQKKFLIPQVPAYLKPTERRNPFDPEPVFPPIPVQPIKGTTATPIGPGRYETDEGVQFEEVVSPLPYEKPASMGGPPEDHDLVTTPEPFRVPDIVAQAAGAAGPAAADSSAPATPGGAVRPSQRGVPPMERQPARRPTSSALPAVKPTQASAPVPSRRPAPVWALILGALACIGIGVVIMCMLKR